MYSQFVMHGQKNIKSYQGNITVSFYLKNIHHITT